MSYRYEIIQAVVRQGIIAIIRTGDAESALKAAVPLLDAGLTSLELPLTNPGALDAIRRLRAGFPARRDRRGLGAGRGFCGRRGARRGRGFWWRRTSNRR